MLDKYYTPEIEEFHEGFEFQFGREETEFKVRIGENGYPVRFTEKVTIINWINKKYKVSEFTNSSSINTLDYYINIKRIRVKYLDEQDILDLGFTRIGSVNNHIMFFKDDLEITLCLNDTDNIFIHQEIDLIFKKHIHSLFLTIKNKSELKRLLKQIVQ